ncbi:MAG: M20/M25/M40 family metallo-hydrolase [Methanospirillaceae archaeon]|nr:M20/M25/M40 family metallo-hydrolase [Methanospirillaceae archaeon]
MTSDPILPVMLTGLLLSIFICPWTWADETIDYVPVLDTGSLTGHEILDGMDDTSPFGNSAQGYLITLADEIGARVAGTDKEEEARDYIISTLKQSGYEVSVQPFTVTTQEDETYESANIITTKQGENDATIIVGAHYDSVDDGDGADDNAGSVAILLELAQRLVNEETPYTIQFVAFGSEEEDLDGSRYFVSTITPSARKNLVGMINLDGLLAGDNLYLYGDTGVFIRDCILSTASVHDIFLETRTARELDYEDGSHCDCADYAPFEQRGIPFAYLEATNWDIGDEDGWTQVDLMYGDEGVIRHTPYDTLQYLDRVFPGRIDERLEILTMLLYESLTGCIMPGDE